MLDHIVRLLTPECDVVAAVQNGADAVSAAKALTPDVIVLDIAMPGVTGFEVVRQLCSDEPKARIIFVSNHSEQEIVQAALDSGAAGYVPKTHAAEELLPALHAVAGGGTYISPSVCGGAVHRYAPSK
jgi:DNA-binding NarL/FixJ family response regulator